MTDCLSFLVILGDYDIMWKILNNIDNKFLDCKQVIKVTLYKRFLKYL